jgi:hypothetical protein
MGHFEDEDVKEAQITADGGTRVSRVATRARLILLREPPVLRIAPPDRYLVG